MEASFRAFRLAVLYFIDLFSYFYGDCGLVDFRLEAACIDLIGRRFSLDIDFLLGSALRFIDNGLDFRVTDAEFYEGRG